MSKTATGKRILAVLLSLAMLATLCSVVLPLRAGARSTQEEASSVLLGEGMPIVWQNGLPMGAQVFELAKSQDLTGYTHLEFDFYVDDLAAMRKQAGFGSFCARLYFSTDAEDFLSYSIDSQIIRSGWNHVVLYIRSGAYSGTVNLAAAKQLRIFIDTAPTAVQDFHCEVKNIYATKGMQDDSQQMKSKLVWNGLEKVWSHNGGTNNRDWGAIWQYEGNTDAPETGVDISGYTDLEFDFYVDDLREIRGNANYVDYCLRIYSGDAFWHISISDQLYQNGYNHVKIPLKDPQVDLSNVTNFHVYAEVKNYNVEDIVVTHDVQVAAENFYATKNSHNEAADAKYMAAGGDAKVWPQGQGAPFGTLYVSNTYPNTYDFSGYTFLEFDYYVSSVDALKASFADYMLLARAFGNWVDGGAQSNWGECATIDITP